MGLNRKGSGLTHVYRHLKSLSKIYHKGQVVFQSSNPPVISNLTATPSSFSREDRPSGNIVISFDMSNATEAKLYNKNTGALMQTFVGASGSASYLQPTETTTYTVQARNSSGSSSSEVTVTVTQYAIVLDFTVQRYVLGGPGGGATAYFRATVEGTPRPTVSADNSIGTITDRHFTKVAGTNTWNVDFSHYFPGHGAVPVQRRVTVTAVNSTGRSSRSLTTDAI